MNNTPKSDFEWQKECLYLDDASKRSGKVSEMNYDTSVFLSYCQMQQKCAELAGQHDAATYIQCVIDELTP